MLFVLGLKRHNLEWIRQKIIGTLSRCPDFVCLYDRPSIRNEPCLVTFAQFFCAVKTALVTYGLEIFAFDESTITNFFYVRRKIDASQQFTTLESTVTNGRNRIRNNNFFQQVAITESKIANRCDWIGNNNWGHCSKLSTADLFSSTMYSRRKQHYPWWRCRVARYS